MGSFSGIVNGNRIEFDAALPFAPRERVRVEIRSDGATRPGSPAAALQMVGWLSPEEADALLGSIAELRRPDHRLWQPSP